MLWLLLIILFLLPALAAWFPEEMVVEEARAVAQTLGFFSESEETAVLALLLLVSFISHRKRTAVAKRSIIKMMNVSSDFIVTFSFG